MPAYFESGFMVREPAWHGLGTVLEDYPGREEAMRLAGHNFNVIELPLVVQGKSLDPADPRFNQSELLLTGGQRYGFKPAAGWKALVKNGEAGRGEILGVVKDSYGVVQNDVPWDIVDAIVDQPNVKYESAGVLKEGALCWVLAWLNEPVHISGDDSATLPFIAASWTHDGSGSVRVRSTSVRIVCANTESLSEAEARRNKTEFTFRHTKNVMKRIAEAKDVVQGIRKQFAEFRELAEELAATPITPQQRELFVANFLPMPALSSAEYSDRVANNVEEARAAVRAIIRSNTVPEAHKLTAYGLNLAGVEYLDHVRAARSSDTRFGRSLLRDEPAKAKLHSLIKEVVAA